MKIWNLLILITFCSVMSANTYYVAPDGNDGNPGTKLAPWKTWGKAFNAATVHPGDTVFFRGGIYFKNTSEGEAGWYYPSRTGGGGYGITRNGTEGNIVCYFAYPGEVPILDCINQVPSSGFNYGIRGGAHYAHFKGLVIRNVRQTAEYMQARGWSTSGNYTTIENCTVYNIEGIGFEFNPSHEMHVINCDSYNNINSLKVDDFTDAGEQGTGFYSQNPENNTTTLYFKGCRAWNCSDQGFVYLDNGYVETDSCWSFNNGKLGAGGHGYKLGFVREAILPLQRLVKNCVAAYNRQTGFTTNDNGSAYCQSVNLYNNTSYKKWNI